MDQPQQPRSKLTVAEVLAGRRAPTGSSPDTKRSLHDILAQHVTRDASRSTPLSLNLVVHDRIKKSLGNAPSKRLTSPKRKRLRLAPQAVKDIGLRQSLQKVLAREGASKVAKDVGKSFQNPMRRSGYSM